MPDPSVSPADTTETKPPFMLRDRVRDGKYLTQLQCPGCGTWGDLDLDQLHGDVSTECPQDGCSFHETHDFSALVEAGKVFWEGRMRPPNVTSLHVLRSESDA